MYGLKPVPFKKYYGTAEAVHFVKSAEKSSGGVWSDVIF